MRGRMMGVVGSALIAGCGFLPAGEEAVKSAGQARPAGEPVARALAWLAQAQLASGAWGQGEESRSMGSGDTLKDQPNVADTCMAVWALTRAGNTPSSGEYAPRIRKAIDFICSEVEASDEKSLYITGLKGTRTQSKLGTYIDTFLAGNILAEVKGKMPDAAGNKRVLAALDKTMDKIEKNQKADGTWDNQGWAPALAQGMASRAINKAAQAGAPVEDKILALAEESAGKQFDRKSGSFAKDGSAGVDLYASAASLGGLQQADDTNRQREKGIREELASSKDEKRRGDLQSQLERIEKTRGDLEAARQAVVDKLGDREFVSGFGSNGGEEFLSHLAIGESLAAKGGAEWEKWRASMAKNLSGIQNQDGSWTGHHCITGKTFCTAAAAMVLTIDRAGVPLAEHMRRR